jgi:hypothetical protein
MLGDIRSLTRGIVPTCQRPTLTSGDPGARGGGGLKNSRERDSCVVSASKCVVALLVNIVRLASWQNFSLNLFDFWKFEGLIFTISRNSLILFHLHSNST